MHVSGFVLSESIRIIRKSDKSLLVQWFCYVGMIQVGIGESNQFKEQFGETGI